MLTYSLSRNLEIRVNKWYKFIKLGIKQRIARCNQKLGDLREGMVCLQIKKPLKKNLQIR
jgi:hypothetical protein